MDLNNVQIALRPKNPWQAFDMGCRMAIRWWWLLYLAWLIPGGILFLFISIITQSTSIAVGIIWLLKPWLERPLLFILSRAVFGAAPTLKETLTAIPSQIKPLWLSSITWLRFSLWRSYNTPVAQLEGLRGKARRERIRVLHSRADNHSSWWTIVCVHLEGFLLLGVIIFLIWMLPIGTSIIDIFHLETFGDSDDIATILYNICYLLVISLVAPFYVAGGFAAYLNRRAILEGWDIELIFRKLAQRAEQSSHLTKSKIASKPSSSIVTVLMIALLTFGPFSDPAHASDREQVETNYDMSVEEDRLKLDETLQTIYQNKPFSNKKATKTIAYIGKSDKSNTSNSDAPEWLKSLLDLTMKSSYAWIIEVCLWGGFIFLILFIAHKYRDQLAEVAAQLTPTKKVRSITPDFVKEITDDPLPESPRQAMEEMLLRGEIRQALSLLLRISLLYIQNQELATFKASMTERECIAEVAKHAPTELHQAFAKLIHLWIQLAWGHQAIQPEEVRSASSFWLALQQKESAPHE
ncbi:DUF4129 domain-containing protein [Algicola sagamiensis]|uniref:DUF4129 domain-containing protein n=1 Tax=Algicola sagamiensis TaxID=163869 RepID=UPI00036C3177|nr:DUF4129 domain-containing protein [Algicola sagamiensis]